MLCQSQKNKKIRLLHVTQYLGTGGLEKLVYELSKNLNDGPFSSYVCCLTRPRGKFFEELSGGDFKVFCLNKKDGVDLSLILKIASILRKEQINVVHSHDSTANLYASIAARIVGIKNVINTEHGGIHFETKTKKIINRFLSFFNTKMVCVSESIKTDLINMKLPVKRLTVIPNGLDFNEFDISIDKNTGKSMLGLSDTDFVICYIGRLSKEKNPKLFLDAVKPVLAKIPQAKFVLVGDGPLRVSLEGYAKSLKVSGKVIFLGIRHDIPNILKICDCFIASSNFESFGLSAIEAMAAEVPVISTCAGGLKEIVKNHETGILIAKNDPIALADAICKIKNDPALCKSMISKAKNMVKENYTLQKMINEYKKLYLEFHKDQLELVQQ